MAFASTKHASQNAPKKGSRFARRKNRRKIFPCKDPFSRYILPPGRPLRTLPARRPPGVLPWCRACSRAPRRLAAGVGYLAARAAALARALSWGSPWTRRSARRPAPTTVSLHEGAAEGAIGFRHGPREHRHGHAAGAWPKKSSSPGRTESSRRALVITDLGVLLRQSQAGIPSVGAVQLSPQQGGGC